MSIASIGEVGEQVLVDLGEKERTLRLAGAPRVPGPSAVPNKLYSRTIRRGPIFAGEDWWVGRPSQKRTVESLLPDTIQFPDGLN